jgi:hypothetical protein
MLMKRLAELIGASKPERKSGPRDMGPIDVLELDEGIDEYVRHLKDAIAELEASGGRPDQILELKEQAEALMQALEGVRNGDPVQTMN